MRTHSLKSSMIWGFLGVILFLSISIGFLGFHVVRKEIIERAQLQVEQHIRAARLVYEREKDVIAGYVGLIEDIGNLEQKRKKAFLDYLFFEMEEDRDFLKSGIALKALRGEPSAGTRIMDTEESLKVAPYHAAAGRGLMVMEYARPVYDESGRTKGVLYGGRIINGYNELVDGIRDLVFEDKLYASKPVGTVTIFQDDTRIATNAITEKGERALGTRVSEEVYDNVVKNGNMWLDRAFVVTDWYFTAYQPIRDINGRIIGILYVGMLEEPFIDMTRNIFLAFLGIISGTMVLAVVISLLLTSTIVKPVKSILAGTDKISRGHLEYRVRTDTPLGELNRLAVSFNEMAETLDARNKELLVANSRKEALNKRYLDLIGFVSHELKGILASTILNAYSVREGFLGMVNFKQQKALDSITRNLDYLDSTVKNFLNLSRIEKGELVLNKRAVLLRQDIFDTSVDAFFRQICEKDMEVENNIKPELSVEADRDLLQIVANNLISNAVKYGENNGKIKLSSAFEKGKLRVAVYNDGRPITPEEKEVLFNRFTRLDSPETKKAKGTGLGLFITKEIVEKHGGEIWVESGKKGNTFVFTIEV